MRYILILVFTTFLVFAKSDESCYTVQLSSFVIKDTSSYRFDDQGYPDNCILVSTPRMNSVRCGCYEGYSKAKLLLEELKEKYQEASIVTTYKSRFEDNTNTPVSQVSAEDQELKLLFQVFSYTSDLENAYKTARKAIELYPNSIYWHDKMAEVCIWTDRRIEAVEHMMYVYKHTHDTRLQEKIFTYSLSAYQYTTAALIIEQKVKKDPSKENVEQMVYIFDLVGKPFESAQILEEVYQKDPSRKYLLTQQLQIYLNMGEMDRAGEVVKKIEEEDLHDMHTAFLVSHYYFLRQDVSSSYAVLKAVDINSSDGNATQYYMQLSDLSWYVQQYQEGADASTRVDEAGRARLVDYERILGVYQKKEPQRAMKAALDAYNKFGQHYLFYTYAYMATEKKKFTELLDVCNNIEKNEANTLLKESLYWMIKAQAYAGVYKNEEAIEAFETALLIAPDSKQVIETYIWFLMDVKEESFLVRLLFNLEESDELDPQLWLPMAVSYFSLQDGDRAAYYIDKLHDAGRSSRDISLLNAYVKQSQNEDGAFYKQMRELQVDLDTELHHDPRLKTDPEFMQDYLIVSMFLLAADDFQQQLSASKKILKSQRYTELSLSFSLRENIDEQVHQISLSLMRPEPWIRLNLALSFDDRTSQQDVLYRYYRTLPLGDALSAAGNTYQISLAQDLAFEGLEKNEKNELLYNQMRQLHNEHADYFLMDAGYLSRTGLSQTYSDMHNSFYIAKGYSFESDLFIGVNAINDDEIFRSIPGSSNAFGVGIKKRFARGFYQVDAGVKKSADTYNYLSFKYTTEISRRVNMELLVDMGARADESVYLLVGGYKDRIGLQTRYALLGSTQLSLYLESADFYSDDGKDIGSGISGRLDASYLQRSAYPDIRITPYYTFGDYTQSDGSRGVIEDMLNFPDTNVISDDFWYTGVELSYGMENRYNYVRVWRPFFSINPYYNGRESQFNYGFSAGLGGEVFGQDNLALVVDYSQSVGGTDDTLWRTYFSYKILY